MPERLAEGVPVLTPDNSWILPSEWIPVHAPSYSLPLRSEYLFTPHLSVTQHLSDMWRSTLEIGAGQLRSVTAEIKPKSPFLCVNRSPIPGMVFVPTQKLILYSMNTAQTTAISVKVLLRCPQFICFNCSQWYGYSICSLDLSQVQQHLVKHEWSLYTTNGYHSKRCVYWEQFLFLILDLVEAISLETSSK